jgi:hypothetical protein
MVFHDNGSVFMDETEWAWQQSWAQMKGAIKGFICGAFIGTGILVATVATAILGW